MADIPVLTIDGPSGSGKGTVASVLAAELGWHLLDSGSLYRILAFEALAQGVDLEDAQALVTLADGLAITFGDGKIHLGDRDVTDAIRTEDVGAAASMVAALPPVRDALLELQRRSRRAPGLVADGRDMGTVVFPDAAVKVFLEASAEERARRRYNQLKNKGLSVSFRALLATIEERDERDRRRTASPLKPAPDALRIDSTDLSIEEVVQRIRVELDRLGLTPG